jgi:5-deoxy-glucuronate isomerase
MTSPLLIPSRDNGSTGIFAEISAAQAGWQYLNMAVRRLDAGWLYPGATAEYEMVHVILGGRCTIRTDKGDYVNIGRRTNVFDGMPYAVYLPRHTRFEIEALTDGFEVASCWVETDQDHPPRLITPADSTIELRGGENASRQINGILPPGFDCHRLVVVEVYTPGGNWSSYPPHKHDVHRVDETGKLLEADLEEIYFYKLDKPNGYAYQRVYTDDGHLDELVMTRHHDMVLVPEGYHPVVSAHGFTTYYLNFLAGSAQSLANADDPAYAWVKESWREIDPRLPLVNHAMEAN